MKYLVFGIALFLCVTVSSGQAPLAKGTNQFNAGVGLSNWGVPIYLGFDFGVGDDISLGFELSLSSYNEKYKDNRYNHRIVGFLGNGNYHFNRVLDIPKNYDLYAGLNLGFYSWNSPNNYDGTHNSGLGLGAQVGGRYFFSPRVALNLELGGGNVFSGGKFGLTFKL